MYGKYPYRKEDIVGMIKERLVYGKDRRRRDCLNERREIGVLRG